MPALHLQSHQDATMFDDVIRGWFLQVLHLCESLLIQSYHGEVDEGHALFETWNNIPFMLHNNTQIA